MNRFPLKPATALLAATLLAACSANAPKEAQPAPQVRQVTQSAHCGLTGPGVAPVSSPEALENLLGVSGQNMATGVIRQVDLASEQLIIVTLGQKPTAGYSVGLQDVQWQEPVLKLAMQVNSPAPDMMVAQVITSPCVVLAVKGDHWQRLEVSGLTPQPIVKTAGK
ncbi:hypothetical protein B9Q17_14935 [Marinobacter vinifirmus]|uniref:PrcB C-terminal domain-containing protein n=1 Tax=Marinobacter vinifirmus TaxID=355591 RepID=A0A7Z1DXH5_9GAMM|nr:protease complex subunit PrcB family protein [Marinobacter vinifirmus]OZC37833.1 hypothetical protein B9Q17_14935 [Marinobacter vinifirmus]